MWTATKDNKGKKWAVDWEQFSNIVTAYAYMRAFTEVASLKDVAIPWGLDIKVVDFDHKTMHKHKQAFTNKLIGELVVEMSADGAQVFRRLCGMRTATRNMRENSAELFRKADTSARTSTALSDVAVSLTQLTRDIAVTSIAIVAAPAGGAVAFCGVVATAGGTALAKYQDTGSKDAALVAGTGSLIVAGAGKCATLVQQTDKAAKGIFIVGAVMVDTMFEFVGAKAEKKSDGDAFKASFLKGVFSSLGAVADLASPLAKTFDKEFESVRKMADALSRSDGGALAGKGLQEAGKKAIEVGTGKVIEISGRPSAERVAALMPGPVGTYIATNVLCPI